MANGVELLRMLEPVVRPLTGSSASAAPRPPIESRSFDSILDEAKTMAQGAESNAEINAIDASGKTTPTANNPLASLSRVDLIDNAALLKIIAGAT